MTSFPTGFVWGAATSAHQIEGGNVNSDWWALEHAPGSPVAEPSGDACDSFNRYREDVDLVADAGLQSYRFSLEWARIEPAPGEFSSAALDHYRAVIDACLARSLEPVVTLHHFTNPKWFRELGGWSGRDAVELFARYVERAVDALQGVSRVCTINEPNMIATWSGSLGSAAGPSPGASPLPSAHLTDVLLVAHRRAVEAARGAGLRAGLTLAMTAYETDGSAVAAAAVDGLRTVDEDVFIVAARDDDFLGVQAYTRRYADPSGVLPHGHDLSGPSSRTTLTGWNVYPRSIGDCLRRAHELAPDLALLVTENGIATSDDDARISYTAEALVSVLEAIHDGVPVEGYWHWSLLDIFEWVHGYAPTFGLVAVDRTTFARTPKPSLDWLGRVAKGNAVVS
jgi:beta-glucosidase